MSYPLAYPPASSRSPSDASRQAGFGSTRPVTDLPSGSSSLLFRYGRGGVAMSGPRVGRADARVIRRRLSERDMAILCQVTELRLMSGRQIEAVHFPSELHATAATAARHCRRVLARLVDARLLVRLPRQVGGVRAGAEGFTYGLGPIGHRILNQDGSRLRVHEPGNGFVDHQLAVSQLVVELTRASRIGQLELLTVLGEPACWRTVPAIGRSVLRPDLFLVVAAEELEFRWFVEIDRDTHRGPALLRKARLYESYYQSGVEQAAHRVFPRVAWITPDAERSERLERLFDRSEFSHGLMTVTSLDDAIDTLAGDAP